MYIGLQPDVRGLDMVGVVGSSPIAPTKFSLVSPKETGLFGFYGFIFDLLKKWVRNS